MAGNGLLDTSLNWLILHSPFWVQLIFMERVVASVVQASKEEGTVLQSQEKGGVFEGRPNRPSTSFRTVRMEMLAMRKAYQQKYPKAKPSSRYHRARNSIVPGRNPHLG
jgi:hypothetical protein